MSEDYRPYALETRKGFRAPFAKYLVRAAAYVVISLGSIELNASDFGGEGVIRMPSARMMDDGTFAATVASNQAFNIFNISFQATPWFETTFRYTVFNPYGRDRSNDYLRDRSYEAKFRVFKEREVLPELSIGLRDVLGTGVWSSEYLVATKSIKQFDVTLGYGWGRLGTDQELDNPLRIFSGEFSSRPTYSDGAGGVVGGEVRTKAFFRGPTSLFGGLTYQMSKLPVKVALEYDSDSYGREVSLGSLKKKSKVNWGLSWEPTRDLTVNFSRIADDHFSFGVRALLRAGEIRKSKQVAPDRISGPPSRDSQSWYA